VGAGAGARPVDFACSAGKLVLSASANLGTPGEIRGGRKHIWGACPVANTVNPEQYLTRRNLLLAGAVLCTLGVVWSLTTNTRTQTSKGRTIAPPIKQLPVEDLLKPGPLPDIAVGSADAPVTIVEYASMTCPACANFHGKILPELKKKYIDTGKVRLVFREFPLDQIALLVSMTPRCVGTEKAPTLISALFARQEDWARSKSLDELRAKLFPLTQQVGLTRQTFNTCFITSTSSARWSSQQKTLLANIQKNQERGAGFGVERTPTFFVNGTKLDEVKGVEDFDKAIEPLLKKS
jgi:protein-disulfide isomerase